MPPKVDASSPKDGRRARTRGRLLAAAEIVFAQRHLDGVTVDELVRRAAVARGSFYNHFSSTDEIAEAVADRVRTDIDRQVQTANVGIADPALRLARAVCISIRYALQQRERCHLWLNLGMPNPTPSSIGNANLVGDLSAGQRAGILRFEDLSLAVTLSIGIITAAMRFSLAAPATMTSQRAASLSSALLAALGVARPQAQRLGRSAAHGILSSLFNIQPSERNSP